MSGVPAADGPANLVVITSPDMFTSLMQQDLERVTLINFWAPWAQPCEVMTAAVSRFATQYPHVLFMNVEAEEQPDVSESFDVEAVPTIVLLRGHTLLGKITGGDVPAVDKALATHASAGGARGLAQSNAAPQAAPSTYAPTDSQATRAADGLVHSLPAGVDLSNESPEDTERRCHELMRRSKVMLFMKGQPDMPRCGFSQKTVNLFREQNVDFDYYDILSDENVRQTLKKVNEWPTFPQIVVKGEFVGGLDIFKCTMAPSGDASGAGLHATFPQATIEEVLLELHDSDVVAEASDLRRPTPEFAKVVFGRMLEMFAGTDVGVLEAQSKELCAKSPVRFFSSLLTQELGMESVFLHLFFREVRELMRVANVSDFQLQDLTRPDPQRFMTHMSAFVNMYRFHSSRIKVFDAFSVDVGDAETERDNLADRIDAAQEQISRIVEARHRDEPEVKRLRESNRLLREELAGLKTNQEASIALFHQVISDQAELESALQRQRDACTATSKAIAQLEERLGTPAEVLASRKVALTKELDAARADSLEAEQRMHELQARQAVLERLHTDVESASTALHLVGVEMNRAAEIDGALRTLRAEIQSSTEECDEKTQNIARLQDNIVEEREKLAETERRFEAAQKASSARLDQLHQHMDAAAREQERDSALSAHLQRETEKYRGLIQEVIQEHDVYCQDMNAKLREIMDRAYIYMERIAERLPNEERS